MALQGAVDGTVVNWAEYVTDAQHEPTQADVLCGSRPARWAYSAAPVT